MAIKKVVKKAVKKPVVKKAPVKKMVNIKPMPMNPAAVNYMPAATAIPAAGEQLVICRFTRDQLMNALGALDLSGAQEIGVRLTKR